MSSEKELTEVETVKHDISVWSCRSDICVSTTKEEIPQPVRQPFGSVLTRNAEVGEHATSTDEDLLATLLALFDLSGVSRNTVLDTVFKSHCTSGLLGRIGCPAVPALIHGDVQVALDEESSNEANLGDGEYVGVVDV